MPWLARDENGVLWFFTTRPTDLGSPVQRFGLVCVVSSPCWPSLTAR